MVSSCRKRLLVKSVPVLCSQCLAVQTAIKLALEEADSPLLERDSQDLYLYALQQGLSDPDLNVFTASLEGRKQAINGFDYRVCTDPDDKLLLGAYYIMLVFHLNKPAMRYKCY